MPCKRKLSTGCYKNYLILGDHLFSILLKEVSFFHISCPLEEEVFLPPASTVTNLKAKFTISTRRVITEGFFLTEKNLLLFIAACFLEGLN